jgi:hypothetical protein
MTHTRPAAAAIQAFLNADPEAQRAHLHDPQFRWDLSLFQPVLEELNAALAAEGLNSEARARVGARLLARGVATPEQRKRRREELKTLERTAGDFGHVRPETTLAYLR